MHVLGLYVGPLGQRTYLTDMRISRLGQICDGNVRVADLPKPVEIRGILCSRPYKPLILQLGPLCIYRSCLVAATHLNVLNMAVEPR